MGRAGRDTHPSTCLLLYSKKDKGLQSYFISSSEAERGIKALRWDNLKAIIDYAETTDCRHKIILNYYGDTQSIQNQCGHCDNCNDRSNMRIKTDQY
jgi:ATP-dependent DNA helicase RecQ